MMREMRQMEEISTTWRMPPGRHPTAARFYQMIAVQSQGTNGHAASGCFALNSGRRLIPAKMV